MTIIRAAKRLRITGLLALPYRCSLHTLITDALQALEVFPEYASSGKHLQMGMLDQAATDMVRVTDVLRASAGPCNRITVAANIKLASIHIMKGNLPAAEAAVALPISIKDIKTSDDSLNASCLLQACVVCKLLAGNLSVASLLLSQCDEALIQSNQVEDPYTEEIQTFSHALKSIVNAYAGDFSAATTAASLCRDSAQTEHLQLLAACNLGAIKCLELARGGHWLPLSSQRPGNSFVRTSEVSVTLQEAVAVWKNALSPQMSDDIKNMSDISIDEMSELLRTNKFLQSKESAVLLSHFLCTRSEVLSFLTESEKAANDASLALSVLNRHLGDGEKGDGSSSADVVSAVGRGVTILAHRYLHAAEGVAAEGFFRKAVSCFTEARVADDPRFKAEGYAALVGYAQLLSKWEKRESHGKELLQKAEDHAKSVPFMPSGVRLSQFLQIPPVF